MAFHFKLDPSSLPQLSSRGDNFSEWRSAWTIAFRYAKLMDIIDGTKARPTVLGEERTAWEDNNNKAMVMIMSAIHGDLIPTVTAYETAQRAWQSLQERFDRDTGNSTIYLFRTLTNLRYQDGDDLSAHVDLFQQQWNKMAQRCQNSSQAVATLMSPIFENDHVKGSFFLTTLPNTMDSIIDNLSTKGLDRFAEIEPRMLDIAAKHNISELDSTAYYTAASAKAKKNQQQQNYGNRSNTQQRSDTTQDDECSWCRKHKMQFVSHVYTNCTKLKQYKDNKKKASANTAAADENNNSEPRQDEEVAFSAAKHLDPNEIIEYAYTVKLPTSSTWVFDTGASRHMSGYLEDFSNLRPRQGVITVAGGLKYAIDGVGDVHIINMLPDGSTHRSKLTDVIYSRQLHNTRLFSWTAVRNRYTLTAKQDNLYLIKDGDYVLWAKHNNSSNSFDIQLDSDTTASGNFASYREFHEAVGHANVTNPQLHYDTPVPPRPPDFHCTGCALAKSTHHVPESLVHDTSKPFQLVHSDLSGKFSQQSIGQSWYFMTFVDDYTRYTWIYFLKTKDEAYNTIENFFAMVNTQHNATPIAIRTDGGGEYANQKVSNFLRKKGTQHQITPAYSHESNGLAERVNRTVVTDARTMIANDNDTKLWAEAVATSVYIRNRLPHASLITTPFQFMYGKRPSIAHLLPFAQPVYVHIPTEARKPGTKLLDRAEHGLIVGYGMSTKIYRVYIPARRVITESRNIRVAPQNVKPQHEFTMEETAPQPEQPRPLQQLALRPIVEQRAVDTANTHANRPTLPAENIPQPIVTSPPGSPTRSTTASRPGYSSPTSASRLRINPTRTSPVMTRSGRRVIPTKRSQSPTANVANIEAVAMSAAIHNVPNTYEDACNSTEWPEWQAAMDRELDSHERLGTWQDAPNVKQRPVDSKWVYAKKYNDNNNLIRHKACVVAKGFTQIPGRDYDKTYSPVARYDSLRLLIRIAAMTQQTIHQMDFNTAYLNSPLQHDVYMRAPPGQPQRNVKLVKALYGLKQSGREWFGTLTSRLMELDWKTTSIDPCVFVRDYDDTTCYLAIYVDDVILIGPQQLLKEFQHNIGFAYKDLGRARYLLGLEIKYSPNGITLTQAAYAARVLSRFNMAECNPRATPLDPNTYPEKFHNADEPADIKEYQAMMGSINFLAICTRPDLAFSVTILSSHNAKPAQRHLLMAKQVLRYLKGTKDQGVLLHNTNRKTISVDMYTDASWGSDPDDARSISGYLLQVNGSTTSWSSKKQSCVAKSTCESEYMACSHATSQLLWSINAIKELLPDTTLKLRATLHCDNQPAQDLLLNARINARSKHIAIHFHFVRELVGKFFNVSHIASEDNLADLCTKALPRPTLQGLLSHTTA